MIEVSPNLFSHLQRRRSVLKNQQNKMVPHWRELRDYINPFRGRFNGEKPNQKLPDMKRQIRSTALTARRTLSSGMQAGLTAESRDWFRITTEDPDLSKNWQVKEWCDEVHKRMMQILPGSNFYKATINLYDEIATFGTGCIVVLEDFENVAHFKSLSCGTYYLGLGERDKVEVFYRDLFLTAEQLKREFGEDNLPEEVKNCLDKQPDFVFEVHHAIEPDDSPKPKFKWRSVYWMDIAANCALRVSGYNSFPVMAPRWDVCEGNIYGHGPGSVALADVKGYQAMARQMLMGVNKEVDPPLQMVPQMRGSKVMTTPGGVTYVDNVDNQIAPLYGSLNLHLSDLDAILEKTKADINSDMYVDFFLMLQSSTDKNKTAREVAALQEEKGIVLGPVLENLTSELLTPAIERLFDIMAEAGLIPPVPEELSDMPLKIEYISVLAQAQKLQGLTPVEQLVSFVGGLAQARPDILDNLDLDKTVRVYGDLLGAPAALLRDPQEVEAMRQQAAEAQAQQQQQAQMQAMAEQIPNVAKGAELMSEIDQGGNATLENLLGSSALV